MTDRTIKDPEYFIVGLQKSGTYWLSALLDAHPAIRCLPTHYMHNITKGVTGADEGRIFDMFASVSEDGGVALRHSLTHHHGGFFKNIVPLIDSSSRDVLEEALKEQYREWFAFHNPLKKPIVGDKTTEYVFHLDLIDRWYPRAKKICIIRDPADRVVSWHFHQIRRGRKSENDPIVDDFIIEYLETQIRKEYDALLSYSSGIHILTYESLHESPIDVLGRVVSYLRTDATEGILRHMVADASLTKLRENDAIYTEGKGVERNAPLPMSHYRKGVVGDSKNYLSDAHMTLIDERIMPLHRRVCEKYHVVA